MFFCLISKQNNIYKFLIFFSSFEINILILKIIFFIIIIIIFLKTLNLIYIKNIIFY